jgi:hypothetical protein
MMIVLAIVCVLHGVIHLAGAAKGLRLLDLPQLTQSISPFGGALWLGAALLFIATAVALFVWPRTWWIVGAVAIAVSMIAIASAWRDARFGVVPNALVLAGVVVGFMTQGPVSLRAAYDRDVRDRVSRTTDSAIVRDDDLAHLPPPVQRFLRRAGVVGQPRVSDFAVRMHGRIRSSRSAGWLPLVADQQTVVDVPARFFYMTSSMFTIPVQGYHRYAGGSATMLVKAAGVVPVARASGREMTQAETVTFFNDMCVLAPATLIDRSIVWEPVDGHRSRATFTNGAQTVRADLVFSDEGDLVNFISDDRYRTTTDGSASLKLRWSTPVGSYRWFGRTRLPSTGQGRWHDAGGAYSYIELTIDDVRYNVRRFGS